MGEILSVEEAERAALHERCAQLWESHEALRAEVERLGMQADYWKAKVLPLEARLAEVEQALREAKEALDKTVPVLLTVKPNLDRPYPDALTLTPWTRWCEPLARRVDDARRSARAVLDKGKPDGR